MDLKMVRRKVKTVSLKSLATVAPSAENSARTTACQKCTSKASKGIGRQGIVLKLRNSLRKEPMPCRPVPLLVQL